MNFQQLWDIFNHHLTAGDRPSLSPIILYILAVLMALPVFIKKVWRYSGYLSTIVHESGHSVAALTVFSRLKGIRINSDHSGTTNYLSSDFFLFKIWATFWGYAFPSVIGFLYVYSVIKGWAGVALTITLLMAIIISLQVRNLVAFITIWTFTLVLALIWWIAPTSAISLIFYCFGWFLMFSSLNNLWELTVITYAKNQDRGSDIIDLRSMTLIPATVWLILYYILAIIAMIAALFYMIKIY